MGAKYRWERGAANYPCYKKNLTDTNNTQLPSQKSPFSFSMRQPRKMINFGHGDKVEVCSTEEGFLGSYYLATVVSRLDNGLYVVRYDTLLEDNSSQPLTETLYPRELRPKPPRVTASSFALSQQVDVFENDGWWVGEITEKVDDDHYCVYLSTTEEEVVYPASAIRVHQEWLNGRWVRSNWSIHVSRDE